MPKFNYVLSTNGGRHEEGVLVAESRELAIRKLRETNKIVLSCEEANAKKHEWFWQKPSMSFEDKMLFTKHLYAMLEAGITITEALQIFIDQSRNKNVKKMFEDILSMIKSGQNLSKSLNKYNYIFPNVYVNMIAAGEESGTLEQTLKYLDVQLEKEYELRKKVKAAFIYPVVLLSITLLMAIGIVVFIMPKVTKVFESFDMDLPLPTRILIWLSNFLTNQWYIALIGVIAIVVGFIFLFKIKPVKEGFQKISLYMPIFGNILIKTNLARFARTLNSLLQSGLPLTRSLEVVADMLSNTTFKKAVYVAKQRVEQGGSLGDSFANNEKIFPQLFVKMLLVGDKTGGMETATLHLSDLYERDVDNLTKSLSMLLEPILLVLMGMIVGGLALSIIMPIYQLPNLIGK